MVDSSAGYMFASATGTFLFLLHGKVERERLVHFIVSNHGVLILYFMTYMEINAANGALCIIFSFFCGKPSFVDKLKMDGKKIQ